MSILLFVSFSAENICNACHVHMRYFSTLNYEHDIKVNIYMPLGTYS